MTVRPNDSDDDSRHPRSKAGIFGRLFFCWLFPIFMRGKDKVLKTNDLYQVLPENLSEPITNKLESHWKIECDDALKRKSKPSLVKAIRRTFQWNFLFYGIHYFFSHLVLAVLQPVIMGKLILHFEEPSSSSTARACGYAGAFCIIVLLNRLTFCHLLFGLRSLGISTRVACASLVYRKIIKLSHSAKVTRGKIINLLSNDLAKIEVCFIFMHTLWMLPLQTILITYLISNHVGVASIFGVLVLALQTIPVQSYCGRVIASLRRKIAAKTDERVLLTGGVVRGIRVIKMYTWEKPFEQLMFLARRYEINIIAKTSYLKSTLWAMMASAQRTPLFITVVIHVFQGNSMSAYTMFSLVQYFNMMHITMGSFFLRAVNSLSEALSSVKRVQDFLMLEEKDISIKGPMSSDENIVIYLSGVNVSSIHWPEVNFLHNISLSVRRNLLYAVVGPVGGGKSSLLKLILCELGPIDGQVNVSGDLSYASQEPWLFKGSVRSNIIFNEPYEKNKYDQVTKACALVEDFGQLSSGDQTVVEENGTNLSGGQCARISLARAVYRNADTYLLDDPLSAVDSRVGKRLFNECINGLLKHKTRILVTHQLQYLKQADEIIFIDNGRIEYQGDFANLQKNDELFQHLNIYEPRETLEESIKKTSSKSLNIVADEDGQSQPTETEKLLNGESTLEGSDKKGKIYEERKKITPFMMYWKYFTSGGSIVLPYATLLAFASAQLLYSGCDYFVAYWTKKQVPKIKASYQNTTHLDNPKLPEDHLDSNTAVCIFGTFIVSIIIMSLIKMACYTTTCKKSNEKMHNTMATSLLKTTMRFFETNDSGQILNRFTKDLGTVDEILQASMLETVEYMFIIIGVSTQIVIINHWFILIVLLTAFSFWKSRAFVIETTRDMMRLEGQAKSPVFSHANSSYNGRAIIRCCQAESLACKQFDVYQDNHTKPASLTHYSLVAYSFWLDLITWMFTILLTYSFILNGNANGANVGLAITQILVMTGILARGIKLTGDVETMMIALERLFEYTELESEDETGQSPSSSWPASGKIRFDDVSLRYSQYTPPVLNKLQFTIEAGAKIGIVGRSGAGKSSLTAALFRLTKIEGTIYIDDHDTNKIDLKHLRSKISILPQEPILFPVSLRKNLDPLDEYDDATLWSALQDVELNNVFNSLDLTLDQHNLSTGQCQLLCLARAILKKNRILVLDEATANVDTNTDSLIQKTIRAKFKECTVLTIAHRLNTIMDCDKILVIDHGKIVEYDHPNVLLKNNDGYFSKLTQQSNVFVT